MPSMISFEAAAFPAAAVAEAKAGRRLSVCLPARNEASTLPAIVETIRRELIERHPVVDELVVIDDGSTDATADAAAAAGAQVVTAADLLGEYVSSAGGKGAALWRGVHATRGDVVAFCDTDIVNFDPGFVLGLVGPLLTGDRVDFVKGFYRRPLHGEPGQGGRVTELLARPVISLLYPQLSGFTQPLAGEYAARREVLEAVPFIGGYGVDLGLLIDIADRFGLSRMAQCDLGERVHRNRPLIELRPQAAVILAAALRRAGVDIPDPAWLVAPDGAPEPVVVEEYPPLATLDRRLTV